MKRDIRIIGFGTLICLALLGVGSPHSLGQTPMDKMEQTIHSLVNSPWFPSEKESRKAYDDLQQSASNDQLAAMITELVSTRPIDINGLYALRMLGSYARPEFETAIIKRLMDDQDPLALGRLTSLLRNAKPPIDMSLLHLLDDKRAAKNSARMTWESERMGALLFVFAMSLTMSFKKSGLVVIVSDEPVLQRCVTPVLPI